MFLRLSVVAGLKNRNGFPATLHRLTASMDPLGVQSLRRISIKLGQVAPNLDRLGPKFAEISPANSVSFRPNPGQIWPMWSVSGHPSLALNFSVVRVLRLARWTVWGRSLEARVDPLTLAHTALLRARANAHDTPTSARKSLREKLLPGEFAQLSADSGPNLADFSPIWSDVVGFGPTRRQFGASGDELCSVPECCVQGAPRPARRARARLRSSLPATDAEEHSSGAKSARPAGAEPDDLLDLLTGGAALEVLEDCEGDSDGSDVLGNPEPPKAAQRGPQGRYNEGRRRTCPGPRRGGGSEAESRRCVVMRSAGVEDTDLSSSIGASGSRFRCARGSRARVLVCSTSHVTLRCGFPMEKLPADSEKIACLPHISYCVHDPQLACPSCVSMLALAPKFSSARVRASPFEARLAGMRKGRDSPAGLVAAPASPWAVPRANSQA